VKRRPWNRGASVIPREGGSRRSAPSRGRAEAVAQLLLAALAALWIRLASSPWMASFVLCPFRRLTGWPCPGCGLTRALNALAHGQWEMALSFHPLSPIVAAGGLWLGLSALAKAFFPARAPLRRWSALDGRRLASPWVVGLALALILGLWAKRLIALALSGEADALFHHGWLGRMLAQ